MSVTTYLSMSCQVLSICILHLVIMNNIEQWRIDSSLWHFFKGRERGGNWGSSAFESQWHQWTVKRSLCALAVLMGGSICLWVSMTPMNSEEITLCSGSVDQGVYLPLVSISLYMHWYFLIFSDWTVKRLLCSMTVLTGGVHLPLSLNDTNEQWRDHSVLWQCSWGGPSAFESQWHQWTVKRSLCALAVLTGGSICLWCPYLYICTGISYIVRFTWCHTDISLYLPISWLFQMGSHWLHWKAKSSLWALAVSNGGYIIRFTWCHTDISLYLPISWPFWMGSHWLHWKAKSPLQALAVLNGGREGGEGGPPQTHTLTNKQSDLISHSLW